MSQTSLEAGKREQLTDGHSVSQFCERWLENLGQKPKDTYRPASNHGIEPTDD